jgi:hypothetical protein
MNAVGKSKMLHRGKYLAKRSRQQLGPYWSGFRTDLCLEGDLLIGLLLLIDIRCS